MFSLRNPKCEIQLFRNEFFVDFINTLTNIKVFLRTYHKSEITNALKDDRKYLEFGYDQNK